MATQYTSLLGLALPVQGELSGTWGDTVNDSITSLLDTAVAGTTSLTTDADTTLTTTTGASNQARQAIILWNPASGTVTRNITAPAQSKIYTVINASGGTQSIVFRGAGPTTGVTIIKGESAVVAWNGSDFIKISNTGGGGSFTNVTISGTTTLSALTASTALALNASKEVVSVTNTGSGNNVLATSPTLVTPALGTPSSVTLTNATGLPISTGVSGLGTGVATFLATPSSANLAAAVTGETGTGALVFATSPTLVTPALGTPSSATLTNATGLPISTGVSGLGTGVASALAVNVGSAGAPVVNGGALGTPSSGTLTNATGLPISTGVSGLGTGVATFLATPSSANLAAAVTNETGSGALVFATSPTLVTPALGTPSALVGTNITGTASGLSIGGTAAVSTTATSTVSSTASAFKVPFLNTTGIATGNFGILHDTEATFTYNPSTNTLVVGTVSGALSGNATTATTLQTARTINGVSFNGSANITVAANTTNTLTLGSYLTGTSFNGSSAVTAAVDATTTNTASKVVARDASGNFAAGTITAALSGNATTATTLQTARTIGGVSFDGSANINLPGVNTAGNQNTSGTAAVSTAATITTSTTSSAFKVPFANTTASTTGNYGLLQDSTATFTYNPSTNTLAVGTVSGALSGNATTATTLATARTINGTSFNGSANITVPVNTSQKSDSVAYQIPFVSSVTAGNQNLYTDSAANITYNPSTNTLTTTTFAGALSGNATTATTATNVSGGTASVTTLTVNSNNISAVNSLGFRNRIINGDMRIDQRNAGASITAGFPVDRFQSYTSYTSNFTYQQNAGAVTPPTGYTNYVGITTGSGRTIGASDIGIFFQGIEGYNIADLGWGAAGAQAVTLSFWVRSSVTGTHSGSLINSGDTRTYVFSFTISAANTWEYKSVSIAGDTSGTWLTNNERGVAVSFNTGTGSSFLAAAGSWNAAGRYGATGSVQLGATSGATFYITGVQLEAGSVASPFERRDYGRELIMCMRYYEVGDYKLYAANSVGSFLAAAVSFLTVKRAAPTLTFTSSPQGVNYSPGSLDWTNTRSFGAGRNSELNFTYLASAEL